METRILKIDEDTKLDRLDKVLAEKLDFSRKRIKDLLDEGNILVNQKLMKASYKVCVGDEIEVSIPELDSMEVLPEPIDLDIVYEDHDIIVINKPKGMVVHPAPGHYSGTLVNALLYHCKDLSGINGVMRPGIVHRIDKDTSGLLVVAKNDVAHESLSQQLQDKTCHREYVAIVHNPFTHEHGTIHAPIGRDEKDRQKMAVTANNSKDAITHFTVLENFKKFAYIKCQLETGRTHQIRVHMQYIGHPVYGDPQYGFRNDDNTHGQYLHAKVLGFVHPRTNEHMYFEAPLPDFFEEKINELGGEYNG